MTGTVALAVELSGAGHHPAAWRLPDARPAELLTAAYWADLARLADGADLDFLSITDSFVPPTSGPGRSGLVRGQLDAVAVAARVAPLTGGVGLVPTATTTHTEPFHLSKAIATLDFVSLGRAGWEPAVSRTQAEADLFGRKDAAAAATLWREAADAVEVVMRLWDSWEDDAVIRDVPTGRYIDRDKLHYIDFAGEFFSVKGPSITPRSPQAHPPVVVRADEPEALPLVGRWADIARISGPDLAELTRRRRAVRDAVAAAGRDPDTVAVLADVPALLAPTEDDAVRLGGRLDAWAGAGGPFAQGVTASRDTADLGSGRPRGAAAEGADDGLGDGAALTVTGTAARLADLIGELTSGDVENRASDGATVLPLALPSGLRQVADQLVPLLVERGLRTVPGPRGTLRERFDLPRPANYYTSQARSVS